MTAPRPRTMFEKVWERHLVRAGGTEPDLLYVDLHLLHEVTSPQAFEGLRAAGRSVRRPDRCIATVDHNVPTVNQSLPILNQTARIQVETLRRNVAEFGIQLFDVGDARQGVVHVIGPEIGYTQPGMTIVCGDSHTSTHGAFGALAFGIGTSEVEHVLATQCLPQTRPSTMEVRVEGQLAQEVSAKDLILAIIGRIGVDGGVGHVIEFTGSAIRALSMEGRMTVCNMSIEAGARAGMISPDQTTFDYLEHREVVPKAGDFLTAVEGWRSLATEEGAEFDRIVILQAEEIEPQVTWGTTPGMVTDVSGSVPDPESCQTAEERGAMSRALEYMKLAPGTPIEEITIDRVFVGSCTNARIEDLRAAAGVLKGRRVHEHVSAMVVPGSTAVKSAAEEEGLDQIFLEAGFEWREAGCSMCLGMNDDVLEAGERCASTSNRNFVGRQGRGSYTHLVSPQMAAAAAVEGRFVDVRKWRSS